MYIIRISFLTVIHCVFVRFLKNPGYLALPRRWTSKVHSLIHKRFRSRWSEQDGGSPLPPSPSPSPAGRWLQTQDWCSIEAPSETTELFTLFLKPLPSSISYNHRHQRHNCQQHQQHHHRHQHPTINTANTTTNTTTTVTTINNTTSVKTTTDNTITSQPQQPYNQYHNNINSITTTIINTNLPTLAWPTPSIVPHKHHHSPIQATKGGLDLILELHSAPLWAPNALPHCHAPSLCPHLPNSWAANVFIMHLLWIFIKYLFVKWLCCTT